MRVMKEQEDKFDVDPDWVMPQVTDLVPEGGSLDQQVRKLSNTYFDTSGSGLRLFGITLRRRVEGSGMSIWSSCCGAGAPLYR